MKSTRVRILEIMETRQRVGSNELARLTHVTPANIRHHLRQLTEEGLIQKTGDKIISGRGRPAPLYTLVHPSSNIGALAKNLLEMIKEKPAELIRLAESFAPEEPEGQRHITQRLFNAMGRLEKLNYLPRWEALPEGPEVILGHCPFSEIVADQPALCTMDKHLLQHMLETDVEHIEKLQRNEEGMVACRFRIL
jgi:predicted ArsR family transcriptional regulator